MPWTPYVIGNWVRGEKFYGRAGLLEEALEGHRNWLWLCGTRRVGKTSFLKQVEYLAFNSADPRYFPVFWDFQGSDTSDELSRGFSDALLDAEPRLERMGIVLKEVEGADLSDSLGRLRRRLRASNLKLLLLCDEVEELIKLHRKDPALLRRLRRLIQSSEDVRCIMAATIRLWALSDERGDTSPFLHGFTPPLYIDGLMDEEARDLIRQTNLPSSSRPQFDDASVEKIREQCDNHPYLLQLVCKKYQETGDLKDATELVATDQMVSYFFSIDFEMLSPQDREALRIIADSSSSSSDSLQSQLAMEPGELTGLLNRLEQLGYLRRNKDRRFELVNYFFKRWFRAQPASGLPRSVGRGIEEPSVSSTRPSEPSTQSMEPTVELFDGRYRLTEEIGRGATGVVWKAYDELARETIAIKILKSEFSSNENILERFRQEILLPRDIGHPNILKVYHLGDCHGHRFITMRWIGGSTLARLIAARGALPAKDIVRIGAKLASGLGAAHARGVIHRDIKPQNILLDEDSEPYLTDFGLARLVNGPGMTSTGIFLGTPDYASPEQAKLEPPDERSDIYALGAVLFEMSTGKRPFVADTSQRILDMHINAPPPDPRRLVPELPAALSRLILLCLEKNPTRRCQTARALRQALEEIGGSD